MEVRANDQPHYNTPVPPLVTKSQVQHQALTLIVTEQVGLGILIVGATGFYLGVQYESARRPARRLLSKTRSRPLRLPR